jgi:hypothetical protein
MVGLVGRLGIGGGETIDSEDAVGVDVIPPPISQGLGGELILSVALYDLV